MRCRLYSLLCSVPTASSLICVRLQLVDILLGVKICRIFHQHLVQGGDRATTSPFGHVVVLLAVCGAVYGGILLMWRKVMLVEFEWLVLGPLGLGLGDQARAARPVDKASRGTRHKVNCAAIVVRSLFVCSAIEEVTGHECGI